MKASLNGKALVQLEALMVKAAASAMASLKGGIVKIN